MEKIVITLYLGEKELKKLDKLRRMLQETEPELYDDQKIEDTAGRIKILGADKLKILAEYFGVSIEYFLS